MHFWLTLLDHNLTCRMPQKGSKILIYPKQVTDSIKFIMRKYISVHICRFSGSLGAPRRAKTWDLTKINAKTDSLMQHYVFMQIFSLELSFYWKWSILTPPPPPPPPPPLPSWPPVYPHGLENGVCMRNRSGYSCSEKEPYVYQKPLRS